MTPGEQPDDALPGTSGDAEGARGAWAGAVGQTGATRGARPPVRRVGRRRVVTADADGVEPREDPTCDDRALGDDPAGGGARDPGSEGGDGAWERWLREQRPPHWA